MQGEKNVKISEIFRKTLAENKFSEYSHTAQAIFLVNYLREKGDLIYER